jgi:PAS domain S-box-containing protein
VAMFRYRLTTFAPVALRTVFESISTGVYVLDRQDRIVDINRAGCDLFDLEDTVVGTPFDEAVPPSVREQFQTADDHEREVLEIEPPDSTAQSEPRYYSVQVTPVETEGGRRKGRLVVINDVTGRQRQRQQLEAQNERLQEFTSVVSHDLRNPLNVASGNLQLAKQDVESTHLDTVGQALTRMETLIEDLLVLAREGTESTNPEQIPLADVVTTAWETVDTRAATLHNEMRRTVVADRSRLHQLFENLFRNAIEHGGEDVTVTVGELDDGFYVADDGPGIPPGEREQVFESGYTTSEEGTGFGLRIVQQVVEAHNWSIEVTESADGGARFEITGVRFTE